MPDDTGPGEGPNEADGDWFDPETSTFGDRLTGAREIAGLDVETLARRLGVKPKSLRAWEDDRSEPRANRVSMLAGLLNVSLVWLMTGQGAGPRALGGPHDLAREAGKLAREAQDVADRLRALEARLSLGVPG